MVADHGPSHLIGWVNAPLSCLAIAANWFITMELSERVSVLEELQWLGWCVICIVAVGANWLLKFGTWWGVGWACYICVGWAIARHALTTVRAATRAHHLRLGTLDVFVDDVFLHFLEFTVVVAYSTLSSISCILSVDPDDSSDLLDATLWRECGPVSMANFCLCKPQP